MIRLTGIRHQHRLGHCSIDALIDINLTIEAGELVAVTGPSGSGKTSLLNVIGCMLLPDSGQVEIDGMLVSDLSDHARSRLRRERIGFVFQSFNLISTLTAQENIEYPLRLNKVPKADRLQRVQELASAVGIADQLRSKPDQLSGGQRQRVAIARAVAMRPRFIVADEPTSNLDSQTSAQILDLFRTLNKSDGTSIVFSSHNPVVCDIANRQICLRDGRMF